MHVVDRAHGHGHAVEVGRVLDVGRGAVPGERFAFRRGDLVPARIALEHVGVVLREQLRADGRGDDVADLLVARPDVAQVARRDRRACGPAARGSGRCRPCRRWRRRPPAAARPGSSSSLRDARGPRSCDCPRAPTRRRGRSRRCHARLRPAADRSCRCRWCSRSRRRRSRASPGRRAAPALRQVVGDHQRARSERGLDPRLGLEAELRRHCARAGRRRASPPGWRCWCRT